jgi:hypothetical protein
MVEKAEAWFLGLEEAIVSLEDLPERGTQLPGQSLYRQLLYGATRYRYRVLHSVQQKSRTVSLSMSAMARTAAPDCNFEAFPPT